MPAAERLPGLIRTVGFALALLLIEVILAAGLVNDRLFRLLALLVAVGAVALLFRFPMASALAMLALTDFIFFPGIVVLPLGPIETRPFELILVGLLVVSLVQPRRRTWGGLAGGALAVFLAIVAISGIQAYADGRAELTDVVNWGRAFFLLTFFYVVVRLFPEREQRHTLMLGAAVLAAMTGVIALLISLGWDIGESLSDGQVGVVREQEGIEGVERVRLAGLSLGYGIFWWVATQIGISHGARRWWWTLLLGGITLDIVVSFNRNMWLGLIVGLVLILVAGGPKLRARIAVALAVVVLGTGVITLVGGESEQRILKPVVQRASTILSPSEVSQENSYEDRVRETDLAWTTAKSNLALGVGVGAPFGVYRYELAGSTTYARIAQLFLHNQYLYLLLIGGIGGAVAFLVFLGTPLWLALRRVPRDGPVTACAVGIAMIMMSAVVAIYFSVANMTPVLALLAGFIVADHEDREADPEGGG